MKVFKNILSGLNLQEALILAWHKFQKGKTKRGDIKQFNEHLENNLAIIGQSLTQKTYVHDPYQEFYVLDPKRRLIHKATVKDRVVHQLLFDILNPIFEPAFIFDSYSCRVDKGTHKGVERMATAMRRVSANGTSPCFILKCDIRKFFASVDHALLLRLILRRIKDGEVIWLISQIIGSYNIGLPLGNLTSQLFGNIYMNELDQFVKHKLLVPFYIRYTDDFVVVHKSREQLASWLEEIRGFLSKKLKLELHPNKVSIRKYSWGIDFLGYVQYPTHRLLRNKTKKRIFGAVAGGTSEAALQSYLGVLGHADAKSLEDELENLFGFNSLK